MLLACAHSSVNLLHDGWMKCRRPKKEDESIDLQFYGNETSSECFEMILDFMLIRDGSFSKHRTRICVAF